MLTLARPVTVLGLIASLVCGHSKPALSAAERTDAPPAQNSAASSNIPYALFARTNLIAWCIVPFDAKKRSPEERARMLDGLGLRHFAYDWRDEHIPTFDEEITTMQRHGISINAWWFPADLGSTSRKILDALERHRLHAQLWITLGDSAPQSSNQADKVKAAVAILRPIALEAERIGCSVALYNHGGWFGEPENQLAILEELKQPNLGLVYNFHHGHEHIGRFAELFRKMQPHLLAVNLNGMVKDGERLGKKILTLGAGDQELAMLRVIRESGWRGLIGIIDHRPETDSEETLRENLAGLEKLVKELDRPAALKKPVAPAPSGYLAVEDATARARLPEFQVEPAARDDELSWRTSPPDPEMHRTWHRSHGDASNIRFSALRQVNRQNVKGLQVAWTYHASDGKGNIQCNPMVVAGRMFVPTPGGCIVSVDAASGAELWRFRPELSGVRAGLADAPARRGLVYWPGDSTGSPRLVFTVSRWVYALDPETGKPSADFEA